MTKQDERSLRDLTEALDRAGDDGMRLTEAYEVGGPRKLDEFLPDGKNLLPMATYFPEVWRWSKEQATAGVVQLRAKRIRPGDPWNVIDKATLRELLPADGSPDYAWLGKKRYWVRMFAVPPASNGGTAGSHEGPAVTGSPPTATQSAPKRKSPIGGKQAEAAYAAWKASRGGNPTTRESENWAKENGYSTTVIRARGKRDANPVGRPRKARPVENAQL